VVHLLEGLHHHETVHPEGVEHLERHLATSEDGCAEVLRREKERQAANLVSIGNCVTSLRLLSALDWRAFFEATSLLEKELHRDPLGVYSRQDFSTRDRYRRAVEKLARNSNRHELEVAKILLERSAQETTGSIESHIGYYLVDAGAKRAAVFGCIIRGCFTSAESGSSF
jgi:cyclic beta-1,2-glucan synthetase